MKFGLIGHPIGHSLSPTLFRAGFNGKHPYELIQTPDFEDAYARFLNDYDGINVTAPFKELAMKKADILSEECKAIGATNLLIKTPEGIKAHNSDYLGVRMLLSTILSNINDPTPTVLVAGMGGAGKAAAEAARSLGCKVIPMNRTRYSGEIRPLSEFKEAFRIADIVLYNIPLRIQELDQLTKDDFIEGKPKHIIEANYRDPSFDKDLIQNIKNIHPQTEHTSGKAWLLLQALTGYEIFTGEKPDLEKMTACL